jgi:hypothetical protein
LGWRIRRYILFFIAILLGFAAGVMYGWVINPVVYQNAGFDALRLDYKTDYVLMVAESYQVEHDIMMALAQLAYLDETSPLTLMTTASDYAESHDYAAQDIQRMWSLASDLENALKPAD